MAVRGQRFHLDLNDDQPQPSQSTTRSPWNLVADIQERPTPVTSRPPSPPRIKSSQAGFPAHKRRYQSSAFKQRLRENSREHDTTPDYSTIPREAAAPDQEKIHLNSKQEIDMENRQRIADMSPADIDQARKELMSSLSESFIERMLKKANIEEDQNVKHGSTQISKEKQASPKMKNVTFSSKPLVGDSTQAPLLDNESNPDLESTYINPPPDLQPVSTFQGWPAPPSFHFPQPPTPPSLDPEDPDFLSKLRSTYFPSLTSNPKALSWMQSPDPSENEAYSPSQEDLPPSAVRFDFRGRLLPPRLAGQIPPSRGLHHHGTAPEAAGYTIPELAHLSRSSFPSQRCIAYQTLGRILYRLGTGVFGPEDHELCQGLWKCIEQGRVLDTLTAEAARDEQSGNRSCWVTATEAVWLWRKGGGRKWKAT
ncbi:MAG: hypothetical protein LQ348_000077 [Seirophora lacunosa]|nr:MAG: hypothetical protein LQ348_000077 [Seirophora lacunosa]